MKNNVTIKLCPVCGAELHITNHKQFKCKCLSKLLVLGSGKDMQVVKLEDGPAVRKAMQVRCRDCLSFRGGSCLDTDKPKMNTEPDTLRICKRFGKK